MSFKNDQHNLTRLVRKLEYLRFVSNQPTVYLKSYFKKLRKLIELEEKNSVKKNHFLTRIDEFEYSCVSNLKKEENNSVLNDQIDDLKKYLVQVSKSNNDINDSTINQIQDISYLIYDEIMTRKKKLFQNRTLIFVIKANFNKLLIIKNGYFGKRMINLYKNGLNGTNIHYDGYGLTNKYIEEIELNLDKINLMKLNLTELKPNLFNGLIQITKINLSFNSLIDLDEKIFTGLKYLQKIDLSYNKLNHLGNIFFNLTNLKEIYLFNNCLTKLNKNLFDGLTKLEVIRLDNNLIDYLDEDLFRGLINLKRVDLSSNKISFLSETLFIQTLNLTHVDLSKNLLQFLPKLIFSSLNNLKAVNLYQNKILNLNDIKSFCDCDCIIKI